MQNNQGFSYDIRRSTKAKRARLTIHNGAIEVVLPLRMPEKKAHQLVNDNVSWIQKKLAEPHSKIRPLPAKFIAGEKVMYLGDNLPLNIQRSGEVITITRLHPDSIEIIIPDWIKEDKTEIILRNEVIKLLRSKATQLVKHFVDTHSSRYNLSPTSIKIKSQKQRWGSCLPDNSITINWQLIFYPRQVMEYVVVHELCHIRHKNHSTRFWNLVAKHMPDYNTHRQWLSKNGVILQNI